MTSPKSSEGRPQKTDATDPETHQQVDPFQVYLLDGEEHPQFLSTGRKWSIVAVIASAGLCVATASSMAGFAEDGVSRDFHVSNTIAILAISFFIFGLGLGPLFMGPLSEIYGRNLVYRISYTIFFLLNWPVAFAPNIYVHLVFRFIAGVTGSAFLSVAGGTVSDLFNDRAVASPMAAYTICPFIGPVLGPLLSGWVTSDILKARDSIIPRIRFINQSLDWRWTYWVLLAWSFAELVAIVLVIPETFIPVLLKNKAKRLRQESGDTRYWALVERESGSMWKAIAISCARPFQLLFYDRMAFLLDLWTAVVLGILYLSFQAYPFIFEREHQFNTQSSGMSFLGIGLGMILGISTQPFWNRFYKKESQKNAGRVPPESRLVMGEVGAVLIPIGLLWLAFTTYKAVPWIVPILASVPFGAGIYFVFTSTFTYLVTAYRPISASAMASNSFMRSTFAAVFPLFSAAMYERLGTVGATALLAGLTVILAPLPFVFRRIGGRIRQQSRFPQH